MVKEDVLRVFWHVIYPLPAFLVTCINREGKPNIITISWCMPISVKPPIVAISVRPERYSFKLIRETQEFAVNIPSEELAEATNFCGILSGRAVDKFKETGLTAVPAHKLKTPLIKECLGHLECEVIGEIPVGDHSIFLGKVVAASADKDYFVMNSWKLDKAHILLNLTDNVYTTSEKSIILKPPSRKT